MDNNIIDERVYTVAELNNEVRSVIKSHFASNIWVCGEIQGLRPERSKKHIYFELVQKDIGSDQIVAKVKVALFAGRQPLIYRRLKEAEDAFELKNDIEVKFLCEVSLHTPTGQYSIIAIDIDPVYTLGKVAQNRLKIIEDLKKRGLVDKNKELSFPEVPLNIGLITAFDSAAYHDFLNELESSGYGFKVFTFNSHMQGRAVEGDVVRALDFFSKMSIDKLDTVVVTRGGGSTADLSWFDSKKIAEKIASVDFCVLTALGHHIDVTVSDIVANTTCKTPTKAGQFLKDKISDFLNNIESCQEAILEESQNLLEVQRRFLQEESVKMDSRLGRYFRFHNEELLTKQHSLVSLAVNLLRYRTNEINQCWQGIIFNFDRFIRKIYDSLKHKKEKTKLLNPRNVLKRGYSVTFKNNKAIKKAKDLNPGDHIKTVFFEGSVLSEVKKNK